tara:strand:- start:149 stop:385 length:237 start_codon:yes stop_codon:yes gene_type:complete
MDVVEREYLNAIEKLRNSSMNLVDNSTWNRRLNTCKKCEHFKMYQNNTEIFKCAKCSCPGFKFLLKSATCPLTKPKWR